MIGKADPPQRERLPGTAEVVDAEAGGHGEEGEEVVLAETGA